MLPMMGTHKQHQQSKNRQHKNGIDLFFHKLAAFNRQLLSSLATETGDTKSNYTQRLTDETGTKATTHTHTHHPKRCSM